MSEEPSVGIKSASKETTPKPASTADAAAKRLSIFQKAKGFLFRRNQQITGNQEPVQPNIVDGAESNQGNVNNQENSDTILEQGNQAVSPDKPISISNKAARDNKGRFVSVKAKEEGTALENWLENLNDEQKQIRESIIEDLRNSKALDLGKAFEKLLTPDEREFWEQYSNKATFGDGKITPEEIKRRDEIAVKVGLKEKEEKAQTAGEGIQGLQTKADQAEAVRKGIKNRLANVKVFGQPATELLAGMVTGAGVRQAARLGLATGGLGGFPYILAVGAAAGGATGGVKEYLRQRRDIKQEKSEELAQIRSRFKREFRTAKYVDKKKLSLAMGRGAVFGAVGGYVGAEIVDFLQIEEKVGHVAEWVQDKAGHAVKFAGDKSAPVTNIIQEKASSTVNAVKDFTEPATKPIGEKARQIYEAVTESPKPDIEKPSGDKAELPPGSTPGIGAAEPIMSQDIATPENIIPLAEAVVMPDSISLPFGSNPWNEVSKYLEGNLGRPPTNSEIMEITKIVAKESDINVPAWGIDGGHLDTQLPPGYKLVFDDKVKSAIERLSDRTPSDIPTASPDISNIPTPTIGETVPSPDSAMPPVYNRFGNPPEFNRFAPHLDNPFNRPLPENIPAVTQPTETLVATQDISSSLENLHTVDPKSTVLAAAKTGGLPHQDSIANNAILNSNQAAIETAKSAFNPIEKISLSGLNSLSIEEYVRGYLEQGLGRPPEASELARAIATISSKESEEIDLDGVNRLIKRLIGGLTRSKAA